MSPAPELTVQEINARMRARAEAILVDAGLSLALTGHMWAADAVCVTSRERGDITDVEREALDKALSALGYSPVSAALISVPEVARACRPTLVDEAVATLIETLNPLVVIILDAEARSATPATSRLTVAVTDFFGSLGDEGLKRVAWIEMQPGLRKPTFR